jgi:ATP-dependent Lon protease
VMPIGGLKEKLLAAHRNGVGVVLIPKENRKDLRDVPRRVLRAMRIVLVDHMDDVLREALVFEDPTAVFGPRRQVIEYRNGELFEGADEPTAIAPLAPEGLGEQPSA